MKLRQIIGLIIGVGFLVHVFITPVFFVNWIFAFMNWAIETFAKLLSEAITGALQ